MDLYSRGVLDERHDAGQDGERRFVDGPMATRQAQLADASLGPGQYTSDDFQQLLKAQGITCSMSRRGECWDNTAMESFFSSMKTERLSRKVYRTREEARSDVFDYIERFYNPVRKHSKPDFLSPVDFEQGLMGQANRPGNWGKPRSNFLEMTCRSAGYCISYCIRSLLWGETPDPSENKKALSR
jgi:putative transposase